MTSKSTSLRPHSFRNRRKPNDRRPASPQSPTAVDRRQNAEVSPQGKSKPHTPESTGRRSRRSSKLTPARKRASYLLATLDGIRRDLAEQFFESKVPQVQTVHIVSARDALAHIASEILSLGSLSAASGDSSHAEFVRELRAALRALEEIVIGDPKRLSVSRLASLEVQAGIHLNAARDILGPTADAYLATTIGEFIEWLGDRAANLAPFALGEVVVSRRHTVMLGVEDPDHSL